ncbi:MAG: UbiA-like polyprenyltransferase [Chloroflexota bacterium]
MNKLALFLEAIKFEHTIFALPFAYVGMLLAAYVSSGGAPTAGQVLWITMAMVAARTLAMTLNRLIDRDSDAQNPRTASRALPRRLLSAREMTLYATVSGGVLAFAALQLNPLCVALMPGAVVVLTGYSYTKRFSWLCHFVLGVAIGLAPVGAWTAVTATVDPRSLIVGLAVATWIAGFDLLYACQDIEFDRKTGLHSVPARFGVAATLRLASGLHVITVGALVWIGLVVGLGIVYWVGVAIAAGLLIYEHSLLAPNDLSRLNVAFFNVNGYIALVLLVAVAGELAAQAWL